MNKNLSIHLQNFPDVTLFNNETELVANMDMTRQICSAALFIRDQNNLRVRLPLNQLKIIGNNAAKILQYKDIIAEEVNVKNVIIVQEIGDLADLKLQINFKKVAGRLAKKIKEITIAAKENKWNKIADNKIEIAGEILVDDEFEIKLITKNQNNLAALPSNDCLVELDINVTKELEDEGLARDIVRAIQQNRKEANLDVSNHIKIAVFCDDSKILEIIKNHQNYIKDQTLTNEIKIGLSDDLVKNYSHNFQNKIDNCQLKIGISLDT